MPQQDSIQILIPAAADIGYGNVATREYPIQIFVRNTGYFYAIKIEKIIYSPAWAKVQAAIFESGIETQRFAGDNGTLGLELEISNTETRYMSLVNLSIDTEVRFTLYFRGWQYGE
jgi:hypothetical protein